MYFVYFWEFLFRSTIPLQISCKMQWYNYKDKATCLKDYFHIKYSNLKGFHCISITFLLFTLMPLCFQKFNSKIYIKVQITCFEHTFCACPKSVNLSDSDVSLVQRMIAITDFKRLHSENDLNVIIWSASFCVLNDCLLI